MKIVSAKIGMFFKFAKIFLTYIFLRYESVLIDLVSNCMIRKKVGLFLREFDPILGILSKFRYSMLIL